MKKTFSLLLALSLAISLCAGTACADELPSGVNDLCTGEEWELLVQTNRQRLAQGLTPYSTFSTLQECAGLREQEIVSLYSHTRPDGTSWSTVLTDETLDYTAGGENIASGQTSPEQVIGRWMNSKDQQANILSSDYSHMGMGYTSSGLLGTSWLQLFMDNGCSVSGISLSRDQVVCDVGSELEDLDLILYAQCPVHGTCCLPLLKGMYTGFDPNLESVQTVTVAYAGQTAQLTVQVGAPDLSDADEWALSWIAQADQLDLLSSLTRSGYTEKVTRLQFADLAVRLAEILTGTPITPASEDTFTDTTNEIVLKARAAGIAAGYTEGDFRPNNPIQRQEICVMLSNMINYVDAQRGAPANLDRSETAKVSFPDLDLVASWALKPVALITNNGIMSGRATDTGAKLTPMDYTTLQEAVTLTVKLHECIK